MKSRRLGPVLIGIAVVTVFILLPLVGWGARTWTDFLWYDDLGQTGVFWVRIQSQLAVGAAFAAAAFVILYANMWVARRFAPRVVPVGVPDGLPPQFTEFLLQLRRLTGPFLDKVILLVAAVLAFLNGSAMADEWVTFRLALARVPFGISDPAFGRDAGFFVFTLPVLELVLAWTGGILFLALVLSALVHLADGAIQPWQRLRGFAPHVKAHLSVLIAALIASRAFGYWLDIWNLSYSPRGQVVGASYTDVHAQLPAYRILIVVSLVAAAALLLNIRFKGWRLPAVAVGAWLVASVLLAGVWPATVQRFVVDPNEAAREAPYIERNIAMTRLAFELSDVEGQAYAAAEDLSASDVRTATDTISNVRLWDPQIVQQGYAQLQSIRPYYEFADVDVDRYEIGGRDRQVLVSAREMNSSLLAEQAQTWVNRHLVYTHGFGLVMSPTSEADRRGLPLFVVGDVPPRVSSRLASGTAGALETKQPRIYFGERTTDYVIVDADIEEFDYPQGDKNETYRYEADGGVRIGSLARRLAWAMRLGSTQVLFSDYIREDSRVLINRDIRTRLDMLAPWLRLEDDAYPVLVEGRIVWVIDAYTSTDRFPNANGLDDGTNYLRNSVKVTVDAFTGETTLYAVAEDPILRAWRSVFPELIVDGDEVPDAVREHFRYPQGLFSAQADIYRTYHMTDPGVFYNKEDQWQIPEVSDGVPMEPFFVLLELPGSDKEHFYLMQPYTPRNRDNMIGWMAVSSDPENYGDRTVYSLPKDRVILGPEQVRARINQDPVISPQLTLWNQRGSSVQFGNMLVLPIKDALVYVQPVFLQSEQTAIPELARVVVAYSDRVEMQSTLADALLKVFGEERAGETTGTPAPGGGNTADAAEAQRLYEAALAAQRAGDWAEYGRRIEELGRVLEGLAGVESTGSAE